MDLYFAETPSTLGPSNLHFLYIYDARKHFMNFLSLLTLAWCLLDFLVLMIFSLSCDATFRSPLFTNKNGMLTRARVSAEYAPIILSFSYSFE